MVYSLPNNRVRPAKKKKKKNPWHGPRPSNCLPPALHYPMYLFGVMLLYISISGFNSNDMTDLAKCYMLKDLEGRIVILNSFLSKCFLTLSQKILTKFL